jgi:hypothetical protein
MARVRTREHTRAGSNTRKVAGVWNKAAISVSSARSPARPAHAPTPNLWEQRLKCVILVAGLSAALQARVKKVCVDVVL